MQRICLRGLATVALLALLLSCSAADESDGVSPLACEVAADSQCFVSYRDGMFKYDLDEIRTWCECDGLPSETCSTYGGEFHTGECTSDIVARCDNSADRTRFFYDGFAGVRYDTHAEVLSLQNACQAESGSFTLEKTALCATEADCDDGIPENGVERCVVGESCTGAVCTQAACEPAGG